MDPQKSAIRHFTREVLGCGCPESVFQSIHCSPRESLGWAGRRRIDIGNRLLVYLVSPRNEKAYGSELTDLLLAGRDDRDSQGFNRFRLALFGDGLSSWLADPQEFVETLFPGDDKIHLHLLDSGQYPRI